jgi:hypothetical protein
MRADVSPLHPEAHTETLARPNGPMAGLQGFSVADLCCRWKVGSDKVHGFIRRGDLVAVNVATNLSSRPQWRITPESVDAFERRRSSMPTPKHRRRPRRPVPVDFYPG